MSDATHNNLSIYELLLQAATILFVELIRKKSLMHRCAELEVWPRFDGWSKSYM